METVKHVMGVSLSDFKGDYESSLDLAGQHFFIRKIGTSGDIPKAMEMIRVVAGTKVASIGLGGTDFALYAGDRSYELKQAKPLIECAGEKPIVDGARVKKLIEPWMIDYLQEHGIIDFTRANVLVTCGVDRFGIAKALPGYGGEVVYGDWMFSFGRNEPIRSYDELCRMARRWLPLISWMPLGLIYPLHKQMEIKPKFEEWYEWADVIVGDCHQIRKHLPTVKWGGLAGKTIITNTVKPFDRNLFRERGVRRVITPFPRLANHNPATNMIEAILVAMIGKHPKDITDREFMETYLSTGLEPVIAEL